MEEAVARGHINGSDMAIVGFMEEPYNPHSI